MSLSTLKPVSCRLPSVAGANEIQSNLSNVSMVHKQVVPQLQVREKTISIQHESRTIASRREMLQLTAASISVLSLLLPANSAEARTRNPSMRQKIFEKLEKIRQKFGMSKTPKDEEKPNEKEDKLNAKSGTEEKKSTKVKVEDEGKKPLTTADHSSAAHKEEVIIPALPNIINGKTVEAILAKYKV